MMTVALVSQSFVELVGLIFLFILILAAAYFTSRFMGKTQGSFFKNKNISVIETHKVTNNKFIQVIRIGNQYMAIGIGKDEITFLSHVNEEELVITEDKSFEGKDFKEIFNKLKLSRKDKDEE